MTDLKLSLILVDDQFGITISLKVLNPHFLSELEANEQSEIHLKGDEYVLPNQGQMMWN